MFKRFHTYELTFSALAAAASGSGTFLVETLYDFWWIKSQAFIFDAAGLGVSTLLLPNLEVTLQEGSSQQQLTSQAAAIAGLFGTGQLPFILPTMHVIVGGANFNVTVTNRHTATAFSARLQFSGVLVMKGTSPTSRRVARARAGRR